MLLTNSGSTVLVVCVAITAMFVTLETEAALEGLGLRKPSRYCWDLSMRTENQGVFYSHMQYGKRYYADNMLCTWFIQAPFFQSVLLQPTAMSLEYTRGCLFDYVAVLDGFSTVILPNNTLGRLCGGETDLRIISSGTQVTLIFESDSSLTKEGFLLRYAFINDTEKEDLARQYNLTSLKGTINLMSEQPVQCTRYEKSCADQKRCIRAEWFCDGVVDCADGSDEATCTGQRNTETGCPRHKAKCKSGECIPKNFWCDHSKDCKDNSDELMCDYPDTSDNKIEDLLNKTKPNTTPNPSKPRQVSPSNATPVSCSQQAIKPDLGIPGRIVGGEVAIKGSWPWIASLRFYDSHFCGGSILNAQVIVTAAHCVNSRNDPSAWRVDAGRWHRDMKEPTLQSRKVTKIVMHPQFNSMTMDNDVAIMYLDSDLEWTPQVQPVCLPESETDFPPPDTECFILGWGDTMGTFGAGYLKQAKVPIISDEQCKSDYHDSVTKNMVCAGFEAGGRDSCQGDSGGPLVCQRSRDSPFTLYGITSWGNGCAAAHNPGVYTRLSNYLDFVRMAMI